MSSPKSMSDVSSPGSTVAEPAPPTGPDRSPHFKSPRRRSLPDLFKDTLDGARRLIEPPVIHHHNAGDNHDRPYAPSITSVTNYHSGDNILDHLDALTYSECNALVTKLPAK